MTDTMVTPVREADDDKDFPWGLLGLLGLAGLIKRPPREPVVRDTATRPGDPNYRV